MKLTRCTLLFICPYSLVSTFNHVLTPRPPLYKLPSVFTALKLVRSRSLLVRLSSLERMCEGRGSAAPTLLTWVALLCLLLQLEAANAATYKVGGPGGWSFNTDTWPKGKRFRAGDVLIFNYDATMHNVVAVNRSGYNSCSAPGGAKVFSSGKDQIKLARGQNYFICNYPGHCQSGMRLAINAV